MQEFAEMFVITNDPLRQAQHDSSRSVSHAEFVEAWRLLCSVYFFKESERFFEEEFLNCGHRGHN